MAFDFSILKGLPDLDLKPNNNKNLPYPMMMIISGKTGSGKSHRMFSFILNDSFLQYDELYIITPNIDTKQYIFLKYAFQYNINRSLIFELFQYLSKVKTSQIHDTVRTFAENLSDEDKQNHVKLLLTDKVNEIPSLREMDEDKIKLIISDDCNGSLVYDELMLDFFSKGRPKNCQCIYICQSFGLVNINIRRNTTCLVLFKTSGTAFDHVYRDMVQEIMGNKNEFKTLCNRIWRDNFSYVFVNKNDSIITEDVFTLVRR